MFQIFNDKLNKISEVLGSDALIEYVTKYDFRVDPKTRENLKYHHKQTWSNFINYKNSQFCSDDAIDLLSKILLFDHKNRITSKDALNHVYFNSVKEFYSNQFFSVNN